MKKLMILPLLLALTACGGMERTVAHYTGYSEMCVDGVTYIQFTSGATVKVDRTGKPVAC